MSDPSSAPVGADSQAASATGPITSPRTGRIVVGVDGSAGSQAALRFAVTEAEMRGARVEAVCAWQIPTPYGAPVVLPDNDVLPAAAAKTLADAIALLSDEVTQHVAITPVVVRGHPADVLVRTSADADLLVLGTRGHGGFVGLLLGSVSQYCVHHVRCPLVIVPRPVEEG